MLGAVAFKIIGGVLVVTSSSLLGIYFSKLGGFQISNLTEMKKALTILKSEIEFMNVPLPEAFLHISSRVSEPLNGMFADMSARLSEKTGQGAAAIWEAAVNGCAKAAFFDDEDLQCFYSLGKTLGYLDKRMQLNSIDIAIAYIDDKCAALAEKHARTSRMYSSLGVLCGLMIVIILV